MKQAVGRQAVAHRVGEADELDAVDVHHPDAAQLQPVGEVQDRCGRPSGRRRHPPGVEHREPVAQAVATQAGTPGGR